MPRPIRERLEKELYPKLIYSPFLRLVLFNFWFRLVFVCFVLLLLFLALFLPRIWRVTPPGFLPVVKISGLDMTQAWSLKRSALKAQAAGEFERANYAWGAAVANNPGNPELFRGALRNVLQLPRPETKFIGPAVGQTTWLLKLTGTNQSDAELVSEVYDKFQFHDLTLRLLGPREDRLGPRAESLYLKALFYAGQIGVFAKRWERLSGQHTSAPELQLYQAAFLIGWGGPEQAAAARQQLDAAVEDPQQRITANRLYLVVSAARQDLDRYRASLQRLEQGQADTLLNHVIYWRLLASAGRKVEAKQLAQSFPRPPASGAEAVHLADVYLTLDLREEARRLLQRSTVAFGTSAELWARHANLLLEDKRWEDLRALALQIRQHDAVRDALAGYSYFLEGRAELGLERETVAEVAFQKAARLPFEHRTLGLAAATSMLKLGYPQPARDILLPLEKELEGSLDFWQTLFTAAHELKEPELMFTAATRAYELQPNSVVSANNYAAALLVSRTRPEEAVKLTLQILDWFPNSTGAQINHGLALLLNRRMNEAAALFKAINTNRLSALETTSLHLGSFEVFLNQQMFDKAREASERIDMKYLFPNQLKWLEQARQQLPAPAAK
jgi:predicted Zn-dependent protease